MAYNSRRKSASSDSNRPGARRPEPAARSAYRSRPSGASSRVSSVRVGDIGRAERARQQNERRVRARRRFLIVAAVVVVALLLVIAGLALSRTSAFAVQSVEVKGATHLTESDIAALAPVPEGTSLLEVDAGAIERGIERDAWVEDARVSKQFPGTLVIDITEREIGAVVEIATGDSNAVQAWAIASDGMWLMAIPDPDSEVGQAISPTIYEDVAAALLITDVPYGLVPEMGTHCADGNVNNALDIVNGLTTELADQVKIVSATDAESTLLTLEGGVEIAFGTAEDIRDKERICLEIMEQNPGAVAYINVRVVDAPTWRAV